MSWADYFIVAVLGLSIMIGLWRGLVSEVLALGVWLAAFWVAWSFGPALAARLEPTISLASVRIIAGYVICFVAVLIVGGLLRFAVARLIAGSVLSGADRLLGMLFGFARGALLVIVMVFLVGFTTLTRDPWWQQSVLLPYFQQATVWLGQRVPEDIAAHLQPQRVLDQLQPQQVIDRLHPEQIIQHLPKLQLQPGGTTSGASAPAPAATTRPAAAATSARPLDPARVERR